MFHYMHGEYQYMPKSKKTNNKIMTISLIALSSIIVSACNPYTFFTSIFSDENKEKQSLIDRKVEEGVEEGSDEPRFTISQRERNFSVEEASSRKEDKDGMKPLSTMEIASVAQPTVVAINTEGYQETFYGTLPAEGAGSGVIISEDGHIVTNNHVTMNTDNIEVMLATGESYKAKLIGSSSVNDLAVIKIDADEKLPFATIGNSDDLLVGELAVAVGNPLGDFHGTVTAGIISSLNRTLVLQNNSELIELRNLIQTDAAINAGNSGGGLFNSYGELIGINVAKAGSNAFGQATVEGLGFAIPTNVATPILNDLVNKGSVPQPALRIVGSNITESMADSYEGQLVIGIWVREITGSSNIAKAGLEVGDIIVEFQGEEVTNIAQLNLIKNRYKPGDKVSLKYYRNGDYNQIEFVLEDASSQN